MRFGARDELRQTRGDRDARSGVVTVDIGPARKHDFGRDVAGSRGDGPRQWPRRGVSGIRQRGLDRGDRGEVFGRDRGAMALDDHGTPVAEHNAVHAAAARVEELVAIDRGAKVHPAPIVDDGRQRFGIRRPEYLPFDGKIGMAPLPQPTLDHLSLQSHRTQSCLRHLTCGSRSIDG